MLDVRSLERRVCKLLETPFLLECKLYADFKKKKLSYYIYETVQEKVKGRH